MAAYNVISADSHVAEPGDLWARWIDPQFRERAPRIVRRPDQDVYVIEGRPPGGVGRMGPAGTRPEEQTRLLRFEDNRRGGWDPEARLKDMDLDGVDAEVLYPTMGLSLFRLRDLEYQNACVRAYNRWLADYCQSHPDRLKGIAIVPTADLDLAVKHIREASKLGLQGIMIAIAPDRGRLYSDRRYDAFWQAAQEMQLPISMHILTGEADEGDVEPFQRYSADSVTRPAGIQWTLCIMIFSGVFERFPGLKVVSAENDAGWAGNFLQRMDFTMQRNAPRAGFKIPRMPSEYFHRNVYCTFMEDATGLRTWDIIGADNLLWADDYPHFDSTWPHSREVIARDFKDVPDKVRTKILVDNARTLYHF